MPFNTKKTYFAVLFKLFI